MSDIAILRTWLRQSLGVDEDDLPDATTNEKIGADQLLNESYWELLDKFPFREKEVTGVFSTVDGVRFYQIPSSFEAIRMLSVEDLDSGQHTPLERMTPREYETIFVNSDDAKGKPQKYGREKNGIRVWPTPDNAYPLTLKHWAELSDLSDTNTTPEMPRSWHEIVKFGALWRGYILFGDHSRAGSIKDGIHASLLRSAQPVEAKEETDTHLGGVEVEGYDPNNL